ncbi:MAG: hypothetical protein ACTSW7_01385 [Candidatus Thorarchaeota archaeon]|nr:hypothetical protein [Thermoplasmatales archaeon]
MYEHNLRNKDGERDLFRQLFIVAIKDAISPCDKKYAKKCRQDAINWFTSREDREFSFERIVEFVFGDSIDIEKLRERVLFLIRTKKVSGVKNISKVFDDLGKVFNEIESSEKKDEE